MEEIVRVDIQSYNIVNSQTNYELLGQTQR